VAPRCGAVRCVCGPPRRSPCQAPRQSRSAAAWRPRWRRPGHGAQRLRRAGRCPGAKSLRPKTRAMARGAWAGAPRGRATTHCAVAQRRTRGGRQRWARARARETPTRPHRRRRGPRLPPHPTPPSRAGSATRAAPTGLPRGRPAPRAATRQGGTARSSAARAPWRCCRASRRRASRRSLRVAHRRACSQRTPLARRSRTKTLGGGRTRRSRPGRRVPSLRPPPPPRPPRPALG
jgi:hypothetical protein